MHLKFRNINDSFSELVSAFSLAPKPGGCRAVSYSGTQWSQTNTRNGPVLRIDEPVILTFTSPTERCLFNTARDVNPFSLLYESLWTLAGRDDVKSIAYYTKRMTDFSDDGKVWHGAYGHRWRTRFGGDQLDAAVRLLKEDPSSRRVVLTMWSPTADLLDQKAEGLDYPCNTHVYVKIRDGKLNIHVINRSNDLVLGLFGTNYVVFSFLLEYLAARIGVPVGVYHHTTDDLHAYEWNWKPELWLEESKYVDCYHGDNMLRREYEASFVPLVRDPATFERELPAFVERHDGQNMPDKGDAHWHEPFLNDVAEPLLTLFHWHKLGDTAFALDNVDLVKADDWRIAADGWLRRRLEKKGVIK